MFDPAIRNSALIVLSNNDGAIVALSPEAKRIGIPKFEPYFKLQKFLAQNNVVVKSSNYALYADISEKLMAVIGRFCDHQYIYSIDESFLKFDGYNTTIKDWYEYGHQIRRAAWRETKIPIGVGFGPTPTLAKASSHASKRIQGYQGIAVIDDERSRKHILSSMSVTDVWGIGNRLGKKLNIMGINTALDLANMSPKQARKSFSVLVERTVRELNGTVCLEWDELPQAKKEIYSTKSFGNRISDVHALKSALISHCETVCKKLRKQQSVATQFVVFASSSPHDAQRNNEPFFRRSYHIAFPVGTSDPTVLANEINSVLPHLFQPGVKYYRAGIGAIELASQKFNQADLFNISQDNKPLMDCLDTINKRYGAGTLSLASAQQSKRWQMKQEFMSPQYTTNWRHIPLINCS